MSTASDPNDQNSATTSTSVNIPAADLATFLRTGDHKTLQRAIAGAVTKGTKGPGLHNKGAHSRDGSYQRAPHSRDAPHQRTHNKSAADRRTSPQLHDPSISNKTVTDFDAVADTIDQPLKFILPLPSALPSSRHSSLERSGLV